MEIDFSDGAKVMKQIVTSSATTTVDYFDGFQYKDTKLEFFPHAEGYVRNTPINGVDNFNYVFQYKDHLGNIRMNFALDPDTNEVEVLEENHYYPFGLKHANYSTGRLDFREEQQSVVLKAPAPGDPPAVQLPLDYNYKYNGKEWQDELSLNWYDYGARNYDAAIGRWMNIDPLAEKYYETSAYTYAMNNPIFFIDPNGKEVDVSLLANSKNKDDTMLLIELMRSLSDISGMNISYTKDKNGKAILKGTKDEENEDYSSSASKYVSHLLTMKETITVESTPEGSTSDKYGRVQLDFAQIKGMQKGLEKKGIDKEVMSVGLAFLHETIHTKSGANWWKNPQSVLDKNDGRFEDYGDSPGFVEKRVNGFRQQLGLPTLYRYSQPSTLYILVKGKKVEVTYTK